MALEAKLQTKEDILKRFEQIKEYRSYFKFMKDIDINDKYDVDVFNENVIKDENFIKFLIDLAHILVQYNVGVNGTNGHWNTLTFNGKNVGMPVIDDFIMQTNESMEEALKHTRDSHKKDKEKTVKESRDISEDTKQQILRINEIIDNSKNI